MKDFMKQIEKIERLVAETARLLEEDVEVKEYFYEIYGSEVEDDPESCVLRYLWDMEEN